MSLEKAIKKLDKVEQVSFIHGYLFAKAQEISETKDIEDINRIIKLILSGDNLHKKIPNQSFMPTVAGKEFRCHCGCNVFGKYTNDIYECNACGEKYKGG